MVYAGCCERRDQKSREFIQNRERGVKVSCISKMPDTEYRKEVRRLSKRALLRSKSTEWSLCFDAYSKYFVGIQKNL